MWSLQKFIIVPLLIFSFLLACSAYNWPHYKLHAPRAKVIDSSAFQYTVEISILQDFILRARSACYPKSEEHFRGNQPCDIWIDMYAPVSTNFKYANMEFVVEYPNKPETKYNAKVSVFSPEDFNIKQTKELRPGIIRRKWLKIDLEYEQDNPPKKFKLYFPTLMINDEPYHVPVITGTYTRNIEFFQGILNW